MRTHKHSGDGTGSLSMEPAATVLPAIMIAGHISDEKPNLAQEAGASATLDATRKRDIAGANRDLTAGGAHPSVDDPGSTITCCNSINSPRKQERHARTELMIEEDCHAAIPIGAVVRNELEVVGSDCAPPHLRRIPLDGVSEYLSGMSHDRDPGIAIVNRFRSV